jgi:signal transduction histidine kinase
VSIPRRAAARQGRAALIRWPEVCAAIDLSRWRHGHGVPTVAAVTVSAVPSSPLPRWQRSLLPAMLGADRADRGGEEGGALPRSARDWLVDIVMFLGALAIGGASVHSNLVHARMWLAVVDIVLGVPALAAFWVRRRWPLPVGVAVLAVSAVSGLAGGVAIVAMFTVAVYCAPRRTLEVLALAIVVSAIYPVVYRTPQGGYDFASLVFGELGTIVAVVFGAFVRARRELVLSLHERARRLEDEQHRRVAEAQRAERNRIAREMHDVLAHRISLISVHAGALEFHPDAPPEEIARAAEIVRTAARAAQEELREVIGVLRAESPADAVEPPQPTLADVRQLVEESRDAGMDVRLLAEVDAGALPPTLGRTIYRLVQEGLTNARKHAAGQQVTIELAGREGAPVRLTIVNRPAVGRRADADSVHVGSGTGLVGLRERVAFAGGRLEHERLPDGGFCLRATLPWPSEPAS